MIVGYRSNGSEVQDADISMGGMGTIMEIQSLTAQGRTFIEAALDAAKAKDLAAALQEAHEVANMAGSTAAALSNLSQYDLEGRANIAAEAIKTSLERQERFARATADANDKKRRAALLSRFDEAAIAARAAAVGHKSPDLTDKLGDILEDAF